MSILTDLLNRKITFSQAATEVVSWADNVIAHDPNLTQAVAVVVSDAKQAASNAVALAGGALGQIILPGSVAVEAAANAAILSAVGPLGAAALTPAADNAIETIANALKAEIDAAVLNAKSQLATPAKPS